MEFALFGLLALGVSITGRAIYILAGIIVEAGRSKESEQKNFEKIRNDAIEVTILLGFLCTILAIVFLFAHEGILQIS